MNKTKIFAAVTALFAAVAVSCSKKAPYQTAMADSRMLENDVKKNPAAGGGCFLRCRTQF
ncbi:MAG: hypothetical protein ACTTKL_03795 [Treponema sp.]